MGRAPDPTLVWDFDSLKNAVGRHVSVRLQNYRSPDGKRRRNARIHGYVGSQDEVTVTIVMSNGDYEVSGSNFVNYRLTEVAFTEGDFVVRQDYPEWRGIVREVHEDTVDCMVSDAPLKIEVVPMEDLVLAGPESEPPL